MRIRHLFLSLMVWLAIPSFSAAGQFDISHLIENFPTTCAELKKSARDITAAASPEAATDQSDFWGLLLPAGYDASRPLVILVHGLDCNPANWDTMRTLLEQEGHQTANFTYPSDQPIRESADFLARHLAALRQTFPQARINLLAHSMGGLVAREFVEGPAYAGGVEHLVLLAPPNAGSTWARYRLALEIDEHYHLWKNEPKWSWTWMITDGLGEAGTDLLPGSKFLEELNARPRRDGVKYTIVAGSNHTASRMTANCLKKTSNLIPGRAENWWGFRHCRSGLGRAENYFRDDPDESDGPVAIDSARLRGVDDFVLLQTDHDTIYQGDADHLPAAWDIVRDRLAGVPKSN